MRMLTGLILAATFCGWCGIGLAEEGSGQGSEDMVTGTVQGICKKANALLSGQLEIDMSKPATDGAIYQRNALGQKVPCATTTRSAGALHSDQNL